MRQLPLIICVCNVMARKDIKPETLAKIKSLYPNDKAIGISRE